MHFFQPEASKWKGALDLFDSDTPNVWHWWSNLGLPQKLNRIEYESHLALRRVSSDFHSVFAIFTGFFSASHKSERTSCILYFSKTNSYFQGWFHKIPGQFQDKRHFFSNSRSFPGPRSNSRTFPGLCEPCSYIMVLGIHDQPLPLCSIKTYIRQI